MLSLKYDNDRLQHLIEQKGINPSAVLSQQNTTATDHRLSLGDPAGLGTYSFWLYDLFQDSSDKLVKGKVLVSQSESWSPNFRPSAEIAGPWTWNQLLAWCVCLPTLLPRSLR